MKEVLTPAVDALLEQLREQTTAVADTKKMINQLRARMGEEPMFDDITAESVDAGPSRPDLYYGKPLATAAQMFLQRKKRACPIEEIFEGLKAGGFEFPETWKKSDWLRLFAVQIGKNSKTFHRLPNGTLGLLAWYPAVNAKKGAAKMTSTSTAEQVEEGIEGANEPPGQ